jgi:hypothetical protein
MRFAKTNVVDLLVIAVLFLRLLRFLRCVRFARGGLIATEGVGRAKAVLHPPRLAFRVAGGRDPDLRVRRTGAVL